MASMVHPGGSWASSSAVASTGPAVDDAAPPPTLSALEGGCPAAAVSAGRLRLALALPLALSAPTSLLACRDAGFWPPALLLPLPLTAGRAGPALSLPAALPVPPTGGFLRGLGTAGAPLVAPAADDGASPPPPRFDISARKSRSETSSVSPSSNCKRYARRRIRQPRAGGATGCDAPERLRQAACGRRA